MNHGCLLTCPLTRFENGRNPILTRSDIGNAKIPIYSAMIKTIIPISIIIPQSTYILRHDGILRNIYRNSDAGRNAECRMRMAGLQVFTGEPGCEAVERHLRSYGHNDEAGDADECAEDVETVEHAPDCR